MRNQILTGLALLLSASPSFATTLTVVNQTGQKLCLSSDIGQHDDTLNVDFRHNVGWTCIDNGQTSPALSFTGHAYVAAYLWNDGSDYFASHGVDSFAKSRNWVGKNDFGLDYYTAADGQIHFEYFFGSNSYSAEQVVPESQFDAKLSGLGFVGATSIDFDSSRMGDRYTATLSP